MALAVGLDDATTDQHISLECNGLVKDMVELAQFVAARAKTGSVLTFYPQAWPALIRCKAPHWLKRCGQAGDPDGGQTDGLEARTDASFGSSSRRDLNATANFRNGSPHSGIPARHNGMISASRSVFRR
jgi:hypothetical protein